MTQRRLIISLAFLSIFAMAARISMDTDTWWHLQTGKWIVEHRAVPQSDSFSYTRLGETWRYPSAAWLTESALYALYNAGGPGAVNLWVAAVVTAAFVFVYFTLSGGPFLRFSVLILAASASAVYWAARPYLMSFLFTAVFLWVLEDFRWGRAKRLFLLPIVMLVWVNSHPGFAIGFVLLGIYFLSALGEGIKTHFSGQKQSSILVHNLRKELMPLILIGLLSVAAAAINPSGPKMLLYPFETLSIGILRNFIQEWQSPDFHARELQAFLALLLGVIAVFAFSRRRAALSDVLLVSVFAYLALLAGRNVALFALMAAPALSRHAQPLIAELAGSFHLKLNTRTQPSRPQSVVNFGILLFAIVALVIKIQQIYPASINQAAFAKQVPVGAVDYLRDQSPSGRLFNSYNWGGYLIWALAEYPVFADGRTDLYSDEILSQWLAVVVAEPGWQARLETWDVHLVLLEPHWPLVKLLPSEGWTLLYQDEIAVLFAKEVINTQ
ncbi:MAG: hypothetical protein O3B43_05860 [Chloroflexi bacterium]|nr:hypothetical protein [Chloroflexota bacterium]